MDITCYTTVSATIERTTNKEGKKWVEIKVVDDKGQKTEVTLFGIAELTDITDCA